MKVVILCGGMGTRLKEETEFKPKPLVEIGGRPILWHIMKIYSCYGFNDFILCLGYKGNMIKEYFLNYEAMNNNFTINLKSKKQMLYHDTHSDDWNVTLVDTGTDTNTGGRIKRIEKFIKEDAFMVTYGDGVANINIKELLKFHKKHGKMATLTGLHPTSKYGVFQNNGHLVSKFKEKPKMDDLVSGGFFVFNKEFFNYIEPNSVLEKEPMEALTQQGELAVYVHDGFWQCMDTHKDAMTLNEMWTDKAALWKSWK